MQLMFKINNSFVKSYATYKKVIWVKTDNIKFTSKYYIFILIRRNKNMNKVIKLDKQEYLGPKYNSWNL